MQTLDRLLLQICEAFLKCLLDRFRNKWLFIEIFRKFLVADGRLAHVATAGLGAADGLGAALLVRSAVIPVMDASHELVRLGAVGVRVLEPLERSAGRAGARVRN